jgi:hypothetical protein
LGWFRAAAGCFSTPFSDWFLTSCLIGVAPVAATRGNFARSRIFYVQNPRHFSRLLFILSQHNSEVAMHHHGQHFTFMHEDPFHDFLEQLLAR